MVEADDTQGSTVGERLRAAREAQQLTLEDVAARTRIPVRHLESIESGDWERLPAPTYSMGFAKNYAAAVGLDRAEVADQLRLEMGGTYRAVPPPPEVFEPADPKRVPPKTLVFIAIVAVIVIAGVLMLMQRRSLEGGPDAAPQAAEAPAAAGPAAAPAAAVPAPVASGPVVLTASDPVWIQVTDAGATLFSGQLAQGQAFAVPASATAPKLKTGKPEALRISVGTADAPPVGPAATLVRDVSLLPADLMRQHPAPAGTAKPAPAG